MLSFGQSNHFTYDPKESRQVFSYLHFLRLCPIFKKNVSVSRPPRTIFTWFDILPDQRWTERRSRSWGKRCRHPWSVVWPTTRDPRCPNVAGRRTPSSRSEPRSRRSNGLKKDANIFIYGRGSASGKLVLFYNILGQSSGDNTVTIKKK